MVGLKNGLFDFQEECVDFLLEATAYSNKKITKIKAPTGSGKTIILIDYIDKYIDNINSNIIFIWLCPGKGELEEQSKEKMTRYLPNRNCKDLNDVIITGFEAQDTVFINWELLTNKKNKALTESERKNIFERIAEAHRNIQEFIIIVDEEHSNDTQKAKDIINAFAAIHEIRVSATVKNNKICNYYEISEMDVINTGLITRALYINEGVETNTSLNDEHELLINLANAKRKLIANKYKELSKDINPLILIQFPDMSEELIVYIEDKLNSLGYNYENGLVAKWMSDNDDKINNENIEKNNAKPIFLLMKQAISTGWDCPRAKILIKLREKMDEDFTIQTIGRLRRMPEAKHYDNEMLDNCYLYTFDEKFKASIKQELNNAFEVKRVFLKEKCKTFTLEKQLKDLDYDGLGERETYKIILKFLNDKYSLTTNKKKNKLILEGNGYLFSEELIRKTRQGKFIKTESILDLDVGKFIETRKSVNTHKHGIELMHSIDAIKSKIGRIKQSKLKAILERLFRDTIKNNDKILALNTKEFYSFIINNEHKLKEDFRAATNQLARQDNFVHPKVREFKIPENDLIKYNISEKDVVNILSNAYYEYSTSVLVEEIRSTSEILFETYCEKNESVDWVYKNGDSGQEYFSIVYVDAVRNQWLFYPDYIVKLRNGNIWIIETKGGETKYGQSKNIDKKSINKFEAFKKYALEKNINWGFVRDKNNRLRINNTNYTEDMNTENWKSISSAF